MFYTRFWFSNNRCLQAIEVVINGYMVGSQKAAGAQNCPIETYFGMTQGVTRPRVNCAGVCSPRVTTEWGGTG